MNDDLPFFSYPPRRREEPAPGGDDRESPRPAPLSELFSSREVS